MQPHAPIVAERMDDPLIGRLVAPGLAPGEVIEQATHAFEPVTLREMGRGLLAAKDRVVATAKGMSTSDYLGLATGIGALAIADWALHSTGALEPWQSAAEVGHGSATTEPPEPPKRFGFLVVLTSQRLLLLDVTFGPAGRSTDGTLLHWYVVAGALTWPRPLPPDAPVRFREVRVLWERQVDLRVGDAQSGLVLRFNAYVSPDAIRRAREIWAALGR